SRAARHSLVRPASRIASAAAARHSAAIAAPTCRTDDAFELAAPAFIITAVSKSARWRDTPAICVTVNPPTMANRTQGQCLRSRCITSASSSRAGVGVGAYGGELAEDAT